jgi:hypothetical protein
MLRTAVFFSLLLLFLACDQAWCGPVGFAVADRPVPVFNTPAIGAVFGGPDGNTLATDRCGQLRTLEFVALPGSVFTVLKELASPGPAVLLVTTDDYPYPTKTGYYLDSRLVRRLATAPPARTRRLPPAAEIVARLRGMAGLPYVWGGNIPAGLPALLDLYPPAGTLDGTARERWQLRGVDCSGLLYAATDGFTPRNTGALVDYGRPVPVAGKSADAIAGLLAPLDLLVWPGHVLIVLDRGQVIESRLVCDRPGRGVVIRPLTEALAGLLATRRPVDRLSPAGGRREFVARRWHP